MNAKAHGSMAESLAATLLLPALGLPLAACAGGFSGSEIERIQALAHVDYLGAYRSIEG